MFKSEEEQAAFQKSIFMTSIQEVRSFVTDYLSGVVTEFNHLSCDAVIAPRRGTPRVLSGTVGFSQSWSFTDSQDEKRFEGVLTLGYAAFGPQRAARTVASVRREMARRLGRMLPAGCLSEDLCSLSVTLGDGKMTLTSMAGSGSSIVQIVTRVRNQGLRLL